MNKRVIAAAAAFGLALILPITVPGIKAQTSKIGDKTADKTSCEYQVTFVNYRTKILEKYKKDQNKTYEKTREKWISRTTYASQWVPKDAAKAKTSLDKYEMLHKDLIKEVDKQIDEYRQYQTSPLDCSENNKAETEKKIIELKGTNLKKSGGLQKNIEDKKNAEMKLRDGSLKKDTENMIRKMQDKKRNNPKPLFQKSVF